MVTDHATLGWMGMESADVVLRAAGMTVTLMMVILFLRDAGRSLVGRLAAIFSLGVASYLLCSSAAFHALPVPIQMPVLALCVANPVLFWLLARALFDDGFRLVPLHGVLMVAALALKAAEMLSSGNVAVLCEWLLRGLAFALAAHALWVAYRGRADDLSEERRAIRLPFVAGVGVYSVAILVAEIAVGAGVTPSWLRLLNVAAILALALVFAWRLITLRADDLLVPPPVAPVLAPTSRDLDPDGALLARLTGLMEREEAWRQEGLTIGKLADQLGVPEYRLRRLINRGLGHRNFAGFLNRYRIEAACKALTDPEKRLHVLTLALDLGFGSVGPFNRAFKEATGLTPTEYRRAHATGAGSDGIAES
jgi:AraC-like DNA-binding protein